MSDDGAATSLLMQDPALLKALCDFVQGLNGTIVNIKRYPAGSSIVNMALERCLAAVDTVFGATASFTLTESERRLLVNSSPFNDKIQTAAYMKTFIDSMIARDVRSLTFNRGLTEDELLSFLHVFGEKPEDIKAVGPLDEQLKGKGVKNIIPDEKVFVALTKGQGVADQARLEALAQMGGGNVNPADVTDGTVLNFVVSRLASDKLNLTEAQLNQLKKEIDYDKLQDAQHIDFDKIGAAITAAMEQWIVAAEEEESGVRGAGGSGSGGGAASMGELVASGPKLDIEGADAQPQKTIEAEHHSSTESDSELEERVKKVVATFEEMSRVIVQFKNPEIRAKLLNDFLKVVTNFKELTLARILETRIQTAEGIDLKSQILERISSQKKSAVLDVMIRKYHRIIDGMSADDFSINIEEIAESETVLKQVLRVAREQERAQLADRAQRALSMARVITKEGKSESSLLILKMKRLFSKKPEFFLSDEFLDHFYEVAGRLLEHKRVDILRRVLERVASNFQNPDRDIQLATVNAFVRVNQSFIMLKRTDLINDTIALLTRQLKQEPEAVVYARILATMVADFSRLVTLGDFQLASNLLRFLTRLHQETTNENFKKFLEQAIRTLINDEQSLERMLTVIRNGDEKAMDLAAQLVQRYSPTIAVPGVLEILKVSDDMRVRKRCISILTRFGSEAVDPLVAQVKTSNPWFITRNAIGILGDINDSSTIPAIVPHLRNPDERVRMVAVGALTRMGGEEAIDAILASYDEQPEAIKLSILHQLGKTKAARAATKISETLNELQITPQTERYAVELITALGRVGDASSAKSILPILKKGGFRGLFAKESEALVHACLVALGEIGDASAVEGVKKYVEHDSPRISKAAQESLRSLMQGA
ncbi:MAG: HEAT repeat domain-containing protein [Deltaproteobacteria bacterium]|nr:HEAT repeat domain-containing protein [Deltaproteobacteria bacterium]